MKLSVFLLFISSSLQAFTLPQNTEITLSNGDLVQICEIEEGSLVLVHDDSGKEQEAEAVNVEKMADTVKFEVLDYNHFKSSNGWIYETETEDLEQEYVLVSTKKIATNKKPISILRSLKKMIPVGIAACLLSSLPAASALPVGFCSMSCIVICRTTCVAGPLLFPPMAPFCFAVETAGGCEAGCATAAFLLPC